MWQIRDFMDELIQLLIHLQNPFPSYVHKVYRRKFRFWSLEHIIFFSSSCKTKTNTLGNQNCQMNIVSEWYRYLYKMICRWNKVLCAYSRKEKEDAREGSCVLSIIWENWLVWWQLYKYVLQLRKIFDYLSGKLYFVD